MALIGSVSNRGREIHVSKKCRGMRLTRKGRNRDINEKFPTPISQAIVQGGRLLEGTYKFSSKRRCCNREADSPVNYLSGRPANECVSGGLQETSGFEMCAV